MFNLKKVKKNYLKNSPTKWGLCPDLLCRIGQVSNGNKFLLVSFNISQVFKWLRASTHYAFLAAVKCFHVFVSCIVKKTRKFSSLNSKQLIKHESTKTLNYDQKMHSVYSLLAIQKPEVDLSSNPIVPVFHCPVFPIPTVQVILLSLVMRHLSDYKSLEGMC